MKYWDVFNWPNSKFENMKFLKTLKSSKYNCQFLFIPFKVNRLKKRCHDQAWLLIRIFQSRSSKVNLFLRFLVTLMLTCVPNLDWNMTNRWEKNYLIPLRLTKNDPFCIKISHKLNKKHMSYNYYYPWLIFSNDVA